MWVNMHCVDSILSICNVCKTSRRHIMISQSVHTAFCLPLPWPKVSSSPRCEHPHKRVSQLSALDMTAALRMLAGCNLLGLAIECTEVRSVIHSLLRYCRCLSD